MLSLVDFVATTMLLACNDVDPKSSLCSVPGAHPDVNNATLSCGLLSFLERKFEYFFNAKF